MPQVLNFVATLSTCKPAVRGGNTAKTKQLTFDGKLTESWQPSIFADQHRRSHFPLKVVLFSRESGAGGEHRIT